MYRGYHVELFVCEPSRCTKINTFRTAEWVRIFPMQSVQMNFPWKCCLPDWQTRFIFCLPHTFIQLYHVFLASALIILEKDVSTDDNNKTVQTMWQIIILHKTCDEKFFFFIFHYLRQVLLLLNKRIISFWLEYEHYVNRERCSKLSR